MWLGEMYKLSSEDKEYIEQLVVEGHTNSRWNEHTAKEEAFLENLKLSQERSLAVARYILDGKNGIGALPMPTIQRL
jgi:outer membrane protein OmpA-like peptidoglycan-associated protein